MEEKQEAEEYPKFHKQSHGRSLQDVVPGTTDQTFPGIQGHMPPPSWMCQVATILVTLGPLMEPNIHPSYVDT